MLTKAEKSNFLLQNKHTSVGLKLVAANSGCIDYIMRKAPPLLPILTESGGAGQVNAIETVLCPPVTQEKLYHK